MDSDFLGITQCDECGARMKLREKHKHLVGKSLRCPKCRSLFTCTIDNPTPVEAAAIKSEEASSSSEESTRKKRRSKAEIREEYVEQVKTGFRELHGRLGAIAEQCKSSEEEVRRWVCDALRSALGYADSEIDTEVTTLGKRVDIALKKDERIFLVIETKNIRAKLNDNVRNQALNYATSLNAEWAVTTNGQIWRLYRVIPQKGKDPKYIEVFDVALLDDDGVSDTDAEMLYLMTSRAMSTGDLESTYHEVAALSDVRIYRAMESDRVIKALRLELTEQYKSDHDYRIGIDDETVRACVNELLNPDDLS